MQNISKQLESPQLVQNVKSIYITSNKIIETVEKKPEKLKKVTNKFRQDICRVKAPLRSRLEKIIPIL